MTCCSVISNTGICGLLLNIHQTAALQDMLSICYIFSDFYLRNFKSSVYKVLTQEVNACSTSLYLSKFIGSISQQGGYFICIP